ncbi:hypothetical protein OE747_23360 [Ruegeria sp. XHP0148]|uniref:Core-binding (CB) domain-containing protein n=2 Tax=Ruegeria aquimaris TaxID=2984333 RepID=A0ABT3ARF8_9RHOB|nr:hypothetical protein [Ruegeria sp. XHP0148]
MAAEISVRLEQDWRAAKARGVSLCAQDVAERYRAAAALQRSHGFEPKSALDLTDAELLDRLRLLIIGQHSAPEQKALLGLTPEPQFSLSDAFDRFWDYIKDEWIRVSHDQQRVKRNIYLKAIRNFEEAIGALPFQKVERSHAVQFRAWWVERVKEKGLKPYTANREINSLRRMFGVNYDIDGLSTTNPFSGVRLKETAEVARIPLETEQIVGLAKPGALPALHDDFVRLLRLLINTGMRPVETVCIVYDRDQAGQDGAAKAVELIEAQGLTATVFAWDAPVSRGQRGDVFIPAAVGDLADMSSKQIQWLRERGLL